MPAAGGVRTPFYRVLGLVMLPGLGLALTSVGFGVITAFISLLFAQRGWDGAAWTAQAQRAEELGYSTLLVMDHFGDQLGPVPAMGLSRSTLALVLDHLSTVSMVPVVRGCPGILLALCPLATMMSGHARANVPAVLRNGGLLLSMNRMLLW